MAKVIGEIKDSYLLQDIDLDLKDLLEPIMDDEGIKIANVFF